MSGPIKRDQKEIKAKLKELEARFRPWLPAEWRDDITTKWIRLAGRPVAEFEMIQILAVLATSAISGLLFLHCVAEVSTCIEGEARQGRPFRGAWG
jgi:hypothetical protein